MLTFEEIEDCFPEGGVTTDDGSVIVSAQWLHDFARAIETKERNACAMVSEIMANNGHAGGWSIAVAIRARSNMM